MQSVKVVLYTWNTLKNGEHPIYLRVTKDRKARYIKTGASSPKKFWDSKANLPNTKHPEYKELIVMLKKKSLEASRLVLKVETDNLDISGGEMMQKLKRRSYNHLSVSSYFDEVIKRLKKANRLGYADIFDSTKRSIVKSASTSDLMFSDVNDKFLRKVEADLLSNDVSLNSVFVYMRTFKTLLNYARKDGLIGDEYNPFREYSFAKFRRIKTKKRNITKEQMKLIIDLKLEPESSLFHSRNYFLFSFYNRGINFADLSNLKWGNIKNGQLTYIRKKTKETFIIGILEPAIKILDYYKENYNSAKENYIFPILNPDFLTPESIHNRTHKMNRQVNEDLRAIAKLASIDENLTTYVARHSFANIMKESGYSISIISELLGHESENTTKIYLDDFGNNALDEAAKAIL